MGIGEAGKWETDKNWERERGNVSISATKDGKYVCKEKVKIENLISIKTAKKRWKRAMFNIN